MPLSGGGASQNREFRNQSVYSFISACNIEQSRKKIYPFDPFTLWAAISRDFVLLNILWSEKKLSMGLDYTRISAYARSQECQFVSLEYSYAQTARRFLPSPVMKADGSKGFLENHCAAEYNAKGSARETLGQVMF